MTKLVLDVAPSSFVSYGKLLVGFYDKPEDGKDPSLYIKIILSDDRNTIVCRKSGKIRVPNEVGDLIPRDEKDLYKRAYEVYLKAKNNEQIDYKSLAEKQAREIEELRNSSNDKVSVDELKSKLDSMGIKYKGNASRVVLEELLAGGESN